MTGPAFLPSVADTLLAQFKALARARIDSAAPQVMSSALPEEATNAAQSDTALPEMLFASFKPCNETRPHYLRALRP